MSGTRRKKKLVYRVPIPLVLTAEEQVAGMMAVFNRLPRSRRNAIIDELLEIEQGRQSEIGAD